MLKDDGGAHFDSSPIPITLSLETLHARTGFVSFKSRLSGFVAASWEVNISTPLARDHIGQVCENNICSWMPCKQALHVMAGIQWMRWWEISCAWTCGQCTNQMSLKTRVMLECMSYNHRSRSDVAKQPSWSVGLIRILFRV